MSAAKPRRGVWPWLVGVPLLAALIVGLMYHAHQGHVAAGLAAALAELDAAEPGWRIDDLMRSRPELLAEHNSVPRILAVAAALPAKWPDGAASAKLEGVPANEALDAGRRAALDALLAGTPRKAARDLIRFPRGRFDIVIPENPLGMTLPDHSKARDVARLLELDAWQLALDGRPDDALRSAAAGLNVARAMEDDPTLIGHIVRHSVLMSVLTSVERTFALGGPSDDALAEFERSLAREADPAPLTFALRAERAHTHAILRQVTAGVGMAGLFDSSGPRRWLTAFQMRDAARREHADILKLMTKIAEASRRPDPEQLEAGEAIDREVKAHGGEFVKMLVPSFAKVTGSARRARCAAAAMRGLIAVERHRLRHGVWPAKVEGPIDPIDGAPLRLKRTADGAILYSIGNDRVDGGGDILRPMNDVGFRLWGVDKRRADP